MAQRVHAGTLTDYRTIDLPTGPLGIVFHENSSRISQVKSSSPLIGQLKVGDTIVKLSRKGENEVKTNPMRDTQLADILTASTEEEGRRITVASERPKTETKCIIL